VTRVERPRTIVVVRRPPPPPSSAPSSSSTAERRPADASTVRGSRAVAAGRELERAGCATSASTATSPSSTAVARTGLRERAVERAAAVQAGIADLRAAASAVRTAGSDDAARAAGLAGAATVERALAGKSPAEQRAILDATGDDIATITRGLDTLSGEQTRDAVRHLARAGEGLGREHIDALARPVASAIADLDAGHDHNLGELKDGLKAAVVSGDGALFAAAVATQAPAASRGALEGAVTDGLREVREDFASAQDDLDQRQGELATIQQHFASSLSPEALEAGGDAFRAEHRETFARGASAAARQAKILDGAGLFASRAGDDGRAEAGQSLAEIHRVATHDVGRATIAAALTTQARGTPSFLQDAQAAAARLPSAEERTNAHERLDGAIMQGASQAANARMAAQDPRGAAELVRGAAAVLHDDVMRQGVTAMGDEVDRLPPGRELTLDQARVLAASVHGSVVGIARERVISGLAGADAADDVVRDRIDGELLTNPRFQGLTVFGAALSVAGLATRGGALADDPSVRGVVNLATAGTGSVEAGLGVARAFSAAARGSAGVASAASVLGRVNLAAAVGLSAFDTAAALRRGDTLGAGIAAAPIVGAGIGVGVGLAGGATIGAALTGPAAPIGAAIGAVVGLGATVIRQQLEDSPAEKYEQATESFLRGAFARDGINADAAFRLRNVDDDAAGVGPLLPRFAAAMGTTAPALLRQIAALPDDRRAEAVETILDADDDYAGWRARADRDPLGPEVRDLAARVARLREHLA